MTEHEFTNVSVHKDSAALIDDLKPEHMSRSAFIDGIIWKFYGHLGHADDQRATPTEHLAIIRLKKAGVDLQIIADAFGYPYKYVHGIQSAHSTSDDAVPAEGGESA